MKSFREYITQPIEEAKDPTGIKLYHTTGGKESHTTVFTAADAARHEKEIKKGGGTVTHRALMFGNKEGKKVAVK